MDELAKDLDVLPDIGALLQKPLQWLQAFKLLFGPSFAAQYFLEGRDASPAARYLLAKL